MLGYENINQMVDGDDRNEQNILKSILNQINNRFQQLNGYNKDSDQSKTLSTEILYNYNKYYPDSNVVEMIKKYETMQSTFIEILQILHMR